MTYSNQTFETPQDALEHFGRKGMKWGVVKEEQTSERQGMSTKKKVAIGVGAGVVVAGAAFAAIYLAKSGKNPVAVVKDVIDEPTKIIHATRGKNKGFQFLTNGGLKDPLGEYDRAGFAQNSAREFFSRYGARAEKVAVRFEDVHGRTDSAGRVIPHELIIPEAFSKGVNTIADAIKAAGSIVEDEYNDFYKKSLESRYN